MNRRVAAVALLVAVAAVTAAAQDRPLNKPPAGFVSLFNGKDLTGWVGRQGTYSPYEQTKLTPEQLRARSCRTVREYTSPPRRRTPTSSSTWTG
jgi:hypothetical protein